MFDTSAQVIPKSQVLFTDLEIKRKRPIYPLAGGNFKENLLIDVISKKKGPYKSTNISGYIKELLKYYAKLVQ